MRLSLFILVLFAFAGCGGTTVRAGLSRAPFHRRPNGSRYGLPRDLVDAIDVAAKFLLRGSKRRPQQVLDHAVAVRRLDALERRSQDGICVGKAREPGPDVVLGRSPSRQGGVLAAKPCDLNLREGCRGRAEHLLPNAAERSMSRSDAHVMRLVVDGVAERPDPLKKEQPGPRGSGLLKIARDCTVSGTLVSLFAAKRRYVNSLRSHRRFLLLPAHMSFTIVLGRNKSRTCAGPPPAPPYRSGPAREGQLGKEERDNGHNETTNYGTTGPSAPLVRALPPANRETRWPRAPVRSAPARDSRRRLAPGPPSSSPV